MRKAIAWLVLVSWTIAAPTFLLCVLGYHQYGIDSFNPGKWSDSAIDLFIVWSVLALLFWTWLVRHF